MRAIGLDVHRDFCEVAIIEDGVIRCARRVRTHCTPSPTRWSATWAHHRRGRRRTKTRSAVLASAHQAGRITPINARASQDPQARVAWWRAAGARGATHGLSQRRGRKPRARHRGASGGFIRAPGRGLEGDQTVGQEQGRGCHHRDAHLMKALALKRRGRHQSHTCASLRGHPHPERIQPRRE